MRPLDSNLMALIISIVWHHGRKMWSHGQISISPASAPLYVSSHPLLLLCSSAVGFGCGAVGLCCCGVQPGVVLLCTSCSDKRKSRLSSTCSSNTALFVELSAPSVWGEWYCGAQTLMLTRKAIVFQSRLGYIQRNLKDRLPPRERSVASWLIMGSGHSSGWVGRDVSILLLQSLCKWKLFTELEKKVQNPPFCCWISREAESCSAWTAEVSPHRDFFLFSSNRSENAAGAAGRSALCRQFPRRPPEGARPPRQVGAVGAQARALRGGAVPDAHGQRKVKEGFKAFLVAGRAAAKSSAPQQAARIPAAVAL